MAYTVSYNSSTLYSKTPITGRYLGFFVPVVIPPDPSDTLYIIGRQDWVYRPDLMALDYYGNEMLFWVFGVRNGLNDLVFDITYGLPLFFPTLVRLNNLGIGSSIS